MRKVPLFAFFEFSLLCDSGSLHLFGNIIHVRWVNSFLVVSLSIKGKCTTHALVYLFHSILQFLDRGNTSIWIFFADFSKCFDLVDHKVLLDKLSVLNVHPSIIRWIGAFLSERE